MQYFKKQYVVFQQKYVIFQAKMSASFSNKVVISVEKSY